MTMRDTTESTETRGVRATRATARPAVLESLRDWAIANRFGRWAYTLPILVKVLLANAAIVVAGAVVGTSVTWMFSRDHDAITLPSLILGFVVIGFPISVVVNYVVLRAAFRPIEELQRTASAVRRGDMTARVESTLSTDPQLRHLAETFNATLDEVAQDRREIQSLATQVIHAQEDERRRLARELHDDTAQLLFAQLLTITTVRATASGRLLHLTDELERTTVQALESVRRLALELRPPALDDLGLLAALGDLCQRFEDQLGIPVRFEQRGPRSRVAREVELVVYRVAQEALTNVAKHAQANRAWVDLDRSETELIISIRDDGRGFDRFSARQPEMTGLGLGLFGMEERVALAGGSFRIWRRGTRGTEVFALIPLLGGTPASTSVSEGVWPRTPDRSIFAVLPDANGPVATRTPAPGDASGRALPPFAQLGQRLTPSGESS